MHHKIQSVNSGAWYTAIVANATSGSYAISLDDNHNAAQIWKFKYNALAGAKSTMSNIKLTLRWQYDLKDTGYKIFTK